MKFIKTLLFCTISFFSNAQTWFPVGQGIPSGSVELFAFEDKLFAGGLYASIGGLPARGVAYWDERKWQSFILDSLSYQYVNSFVNYKDELYAHGGFLYFSLGFGSILKFDQETNSWIELPNSEIAMQSQNLPGFLRGEVNSAIEFQDELYIGGDFERVGDKDIRNIAKWDGIEWDSITSGFENEFSEIISFEIFNENLIISGIIKFNDDEKYTRVISWDGETSTHLVGESLKDSIGFYQGYFFDFEVFQGELYAVGLDIKTSDNDQSYSLVKWNGIHWEGLNGFESDELKLTALKSFGNFLAIGGREGNLEIDSIKGVTFLYNENVTKKIEGDFSNIIVNFAEYNKQLFVGTAIRATFNPNDIGIYRLGGIPPKVEVNSSCNFFPNPTEGELMINYEALENTTTIVSFYTLSGIQVHQEIFNDLKGVYLRKFNLEDLLTGIYIVQVQSKGINESKMIMKN